MDDGTAQLERIVNSKPIVQSKDSDAVTTVSTDGKKVS